MSYTLLFMFHQYYAIVGNLFKITERRKKQLKDEILHNFKEF